MIMLFRIDILDKSERTTDSIKHNHATEIKNFYTKVKRKSYSCYGHTRTGKVNLKHFFIDNLLTFATLFTNSRRAVFPYYRIPIGILSSKPLQCPCVLHYNN